MGRQVRRNSSDERWIRRWRAGSPTVCYGKWLIYRWFTREILVIFYSIPYSYGSLPERNQRFRCWELDEISEPFTSPSQERAKGSPWAWLFASSFGWHINFLLGQIAQVGLLNPYRTEFREEAFLKHFIWIERVPPFPFPGLLRFQVLYTVVGGQYSCAACSRSQSWVPAFTFKSM